AADPDVVLRVDGDAGVLGWPVDAGVLAPPVGDERAGRAELEHVRRWGAAVARRRIGAGARFAARTERVGEVHDIDVVARVDGDADGTTPSVGWVKARAAAALATPLAMSIECLCVTIASGSSRARSGGRRRARNGGNCNAGGGRAHGAGWRIGGRNMHKRGTGSAVLATPRTRFSPPPGDPRPTFSRR